MGIETFVAAHSSKDRVGANVTVLSYESGVGTFVTVQAGIFGIGTICTVFASELGAARRTGGGQIMRVDTIIAVGPGEPRSTG